MMELLLRIEEIKTGGREPRSADTWIREMCMIIPL
jgi:hypothetical protein